MTANYRQESGSKKKRVLYLDSLRGNPRKNLPWVGARPKIKGGETTRTLRKDKLLALSRQSWAYADGESAEAFLGTNSVEERSRCHVIGIGKNLPMFKGSSGHILLNDKI